MKIVYSYYLLLTLVLGTLFSSASEPDTLITVGTLWKYLDNGTNQGSAWTLSLFNDSSWASGNAELGYGDGDEATLISYGPNAINKYITTYFRKAFTVTDASIYKALRLNLKRDDGAIVYINGAEVYSSNMPLGTINYTTLAPASISGGAEQLFILSCVSASNLVNGNNVIAVEVHQNAVNSSDISFDLSLIADTDAEVSRGPYLQIATPTSINICWRTNYPEISKVFFGTTLSVSDSIVNSSLDINHIVELSGLIPNTKYYYALSASNEIIAGDLNTFFITPPSTATAQPIRIWTMGDMGTGNVQQNQVRDAYMNYTGNKYTNLILWLGDDAYPTGTDEQYSSNVFTGHYESILMQSVVYSACGNHDLFSTNSIIQTGPYYDIFTLPKNGEAGGVASGSEAYYSFNYANIHFICLESNIDSFGIINTNNMISWLNTDLEANVQQWTIVFMHCPPYSKGYHDSDTDPDMTFIRQNINPILESYKVDLVLSGHDHDYERTCLINGHYGLSSSYNSSMRIDSGNGTPPNYYRKLWPLYLGTVYAVVGSAGDIEPVQSDWPYPAMSASLDTVFGSMVIDVTGDTLDAKFLTLNGNVADHFAIYKHFTIGIQNINSDPTELYIFPDPVNTELNIRYSQNTNKDVTVSILNLLGQTLKSWNEKREISFSRKIDISNFSSGIYYVSVQNAEAVILKKFVKE